MARDRGAAQETFTAGHPATAATPAESGAHGDRLAFLLGSSPAVLYSYRATGDHAPTFVSDNVRHLLGYEPREYLRGPGFWRERVHPDDLPRV
jgi:adenylate cyclase